MRVQAAVSNGSASQRFHSDKTATNHFLCFFFSFFNVRFAETEADTFLCLS